jgi:hypothetical protein
MRITDLYKSVFLSLLVLFVSCKKDPPSTPIVSIPSGDTLLAKYVLIDNYNNPSVDSILTIEYNYDIYHRLTNYTIIQVDTAYNSWKSITNVLFYYPFIGSIYPSAVSSIADNYFGGSIYRSDTAISQFNFDNSFSSGVVYAKGVGPLSGDSAAWSYNFRSNIYQIDTFYTNGSITSFDTTLYQQTLTGNHITAALINYGRGTTDPRTFSYTSISYNNHKNPFQGLSLYFFMTHEPDYDDEMGYFGGWGYATNIISAYTLDYSDNSNPSSVNFLYSTNNYTFNSNGYPQSYDYQSSFSGSIFRSGKKVFYYTH